MKPGVNMSVECIATRRSEISRDRVRSALWTSLAASLLAMAGCGGGSSKSAPATTATASIAASAPATVAVESLPSLDAKPTPVEASRLLAQATMGATANDVSSLSNSSINAWLDDQFNKPFVSLVEAMVAADPTALGATGETGPYQSAQWEQSIRGPDQLRQRARLALSQILVVSGSNGALNVRPVFVESHFDTLGRHAFGNYRDMLQESILNPGMAMFLSYLANERDYPGNPRHPDENLAREVMQLFTIGLVQLNADGTPKHDASGKTIPTYDQDTVRGMAKVFTGWAFSPLDAKTPYGFSGFPAEDSRRYFARPLISWPAHHSPSEKKLLDGVVIPAGGSAESDMKIALDQLFNHPNTGPFIGKQLIQRMVTSNPSPAYVARISAVFANNGKGVRGDLKAVFRAILTDPEARSAKVAQGESFGRLRDPIFRFTNLARGANMQVPGGGLGFIPNLGDTDTAFGQSLMYAPTVFGFSRPGFAPKSFLAKGLVAPEMQNASEETVVKVSDQVGHIIHSTDGVGRFCCNEFPKPEISRWSAMADQPVTLVDDMNTIFTGGAMSATTAQTISTALLELGTDQQDWRLKRAQLALYLTLNSTAYLTQK